MGLITEEFKSLLKKFDKNPEILDSSIFIDGIFASKDREEIENITIASKYSCHIMDYVIKMFENAIDQEIPISHSKISNDIKNYTEKPNFVSRFKEKDEKLSNMDTSLLELGNLPFIQSGGDYNLNIFGQSNSKKLTSDVIICKINTRYKDYNSLIVRSFMIDAQNSQQTKYKILLEAFNFLISKLTEGRILGEIYEETLNFIASKDEELKDKLPENFGFALGVDVNSSIQIKKGSKYRITNGMVFFLSLSLDDLVNEKRFKYALQVGDTVIVKPHVLTNSVSKLLSEINYDMEDEDDEDNNGIAENDIEMDPGGKY